MKVFFRYALPLFALVLAGCEEHHDKSKQPLHPTYMIYSPNGEPLNGGTLGKPTCEQAMTGWFNRLSGANGGRIPRDVFLKDTLVQFNRMDIDHNGFIVSEELDRFREPYRQEAATSPASNTEDQEQPKRRHGYSGGGKGKGNSSPSDPSLSAADPVMSADANLDFRVTSQEFLKQAEDTFTTLDSDHDGFLERTEVLTLCQKKH